MHRRVSLLVTALLACPLEATAGPIVSGDPEVVFSWSDERCETWDIPDTPARAWRDAEGHAHVVAGSERTRASAGPDLDQVTRDCDVLYQATGNPDPAAIDEHAWIHSIHTNDGKRVIALVHEEYHAETDLPCATEVSGSCWRNAVVEVVSDDGGRTFRRNGLSLVAGLPYRFDGEQGARSGYFNPSNIIERDGYLYVFVWASDYGAQRRGPCLLRRPVDGAAGDWRAWDGTDFTTRFVDPYREAISDPADHVCAPIPGVGSVISSVVATYDGRFIALTPTTRSNEDGLRVSGIYWLESTDLLTWSTPDLLLPVPLLWRHGCDEEDVYAYPSLIDPTSPSRTFATIGDRPWLYLSQISLVDCRAGPDRNLVRFPISLPAP